MKIRLIFAAAVLGFVSLVCFGCKGNGMRFVEVTTGGNKDRKLPAPGNFLPDAEAAARHAYPILVSAYGKKAVESQLPLRVGFLDGNWQISGTFPYGKAVGGVFTIVLQPSDGKVLLLQHDE